MNEIDMSPEALNLLGIVFVLAVIAIRILVGMLERIPSEDADKAQAETREEEFENHD